MAELFKTLMQAGQADGSKSTVLKPMMSTLAILLVGMAGAVLGGGPTWLVIGMFGLVAGIVVLLFGAFVYFGLRNPDALRSEQYTIRRMEIERGMIGDNISGLAHVTREREDVPKLAASSGDDEGGEDG